jgi:hypothetical protein
MSIGKIRVPQNGGMVIFTAKDEKAAKRVAKKN